MLIEQETITEPKKLMSRQFDETIFRYCTFEDFHAEGGHVAGALLSCTLRNLDIYWGLFNLCLFVECQFENCTFRGTGFTGSRFVECSFIGCRFVKDNLGGDCTFGDARWYQCAQKDCEGLGDRVSMA
ncbi:pentapeptide repeat-containing protein [Nevskia soli]|uniref:pentapeptide repeat-containing protein n=1 Tax=Nevskia soli TaxID=418856 RepID=UPI0004A72B86